MKNKYTKPTIVSTDIQSDESEGHYGPPGQGYTPEHPEKYNEEYEYESELWD